MDAPRSSQTTPGGIFALVREGRAKSRSELARVTGLAPSTVALRVQELIDHGYLEELGATESSGGRRARRLVVASADRVVAGVDLGARHASIRLYDLGGALVGARDARIDIALPPERVLRRLHEEIAELCREVSPDARLAGIGLAVPGPVDVPGRRVISPSRMPGWNGIDPAAILSGISGVLVRTENDANAMAVGEYLAGDRRAGHLIVVKVGSSIGTGVLASGTLHRGFRGVAGDVSHTAVADAPQVLCSCGRLGCLDAVAGGRAIVEALRAEGVDIDEVAQVAELARDAHPLATRLLREAGSRVGAVLATLIGFFNPERVVLAGSLSVSPAFVAAVRSSIYDRTLPMSIEGLEIAASTAGPDVGARGAAALVVDEVLAAETIDEIIRASATSFENRT